MKCFKASNLVLKGILGPTLCPPLPPPNMFFDVIFNISTYVLGKHNVSTLCVEGLYKFL
jgi:hypothetical protein